MTIVIATRWYRSPERDLLDSSGLTMPKQEVLVYTDQQERSVSLILLILCLACAGSISAMLGTDRNWDLQNYHIYGPYAWIHQRLLFDVAPAQVQSYINPALYLPHYLLYFALQDSPRIFAFLMGLPAGLLGYLVFRIMWEHLSPICGSGYAGWAATGLAGLLGLSGAAVLPGVGLSSADITIAVPQALAYLLTLREVRRKDAGLPVHLYRLGLVGLLAGVALGLKLTATPFSVAIGLTGLLLLGPRSALFMATGMCIGFLVSWGPFAYELWRATGNPLFPFYNNIFKSPEWLAVHPSDRRFLPRSALQSIFYPFWWTTRNAGIVTELEMRDPRIALGYIALVLLCLNLLVSRTIRERRVLLLPVGVAVTYYIVWVSLFGIYRYLIVLEILASALIAILIMSAVKRRTAIGVLLLFVITGSSIAYTIHPNWGRGPHGARLLDVEPLPVEPGALVVAVGSAPIGYLVPYLPGNVRVLSILNNMLRPEQKHGLNARVHESIAAHEGAIWLIVDSSLPGKESVQALAAYGLQYAGDCSLVKSSFAPAGHRFCPLRKMAARDADITVKD